MGAVTYRHVIKSEPLKKNLGVCRCRHSPHSFAATQLLQLLHYSWQVCVLLACSRVFSETVVLKRFTLAYR